jgi:hypothetical protein
MADEFPAQQPAFLSEWNFVTATGAPPLTTEVRLNQTSQKAANRLRIHKITANGIDASIQLDVVKIGDVIKLHDLNDTTKWHDFAVTAAPIKQVDYWDYPVNWQTGGGNSLTAGKVAINLPTIGISVSVTAPAALHVATNHVDITGQLIIRDFAYPFQGIHYTNPGLTRRQWYAGMAMQGWIANAASPAANLIGKIADYCFKVADSMIEHEDAEAAGESQPVAGQPKVTTIEQLKNEQAAEVQALARKAS